VVDEKQPTPGDRPRTKQPRPSVSEGNVKQTALEALEGPAAAADAESKAKRKRILAKLVRWSKIAIVSALVVGVVGFIALVIFVRRLEAELPSIADMRGNYHPPQVTRVLARDGTLLAELFTERRTVVPIASLPAHVKLAVLAAEDAGFYEHEGLNYYGILRAFAVNLKSGRTRQGGSTITQQVVKNLLLDSERSYKRKAREALLARKLEQELTKDEILELYLNHIYFGHGRYGIEEAARDNFGKPAKDLTIAEAALLAGLVAGPELFSPRKDVKKALVRRSFVLAQMREKGFLNEAQFQVADAEVVRVAPATEANNELAPEAVEIAKRTLHEIDATGAARGGYTITTTIDPRLQAAARKALRDNLQAFDKRHGLGSGIGVVTRPTSPSADKKGKAPPKPTLLKDPAYEGTPSFDRHRVYVGVVAGTDDAQGLIDVRVGTVMGSFKLADYDRYNPDKAVPSAFAQVGTRVRVSLLAPVPEGIAGTAPGAALAKVPLRLESGPESAMVAVDARSRDVLALVGSYEAVTGGLDRATQSKRQPGSTFKPIVYSYAIHSRRYTAASLIDVTPATFGTYKPSNYEGWTATDPLRLREVLANSVNIGAVRVLEDVGPANVVEWGHALGIASTMKPDLSLALGSYEVAPLELCGAYATFAAGGEYQAPRLVTRIVGPDGKDVPLKTPPPPHRVLDETEAYVITSMLGSVVDHGTAVRAKSELAGRPVAGKTGTSNASKDTWFAGYSTEIAAVVWVGYDDGKPLGSAETGASAALPAWISFMKAAHQHKPPSEFPRPAGIVTAKIDTRTGKLPYDGDLETMDEVFLAGTEPTEVGAEVKPTAPPHPASDGGATEALPTEP
jgi:penicillin-binding protein 1A